ncbi:MAG TPA: hypothetical protein PKE55_04290 [Kiritimatiellia bacterium]|nr:hypothetical protein [Kiritimatiellia bacterium]
MTEGRGGLIRVALAVVALVAFDGVARGARHVPSSFDLGFLASRHEDAFGHQRVKVAGPFYERAETGAGQRVGAFRPLFSHAVDPVQDRSLQDVVWPLYTGRRLHGESQWRAGVFYGFTHGTNDPVRKRTWLIPFYFQGRTAEGAFYAALFPLGGTIHDFVGRDKVQFALFPLYLRTTFKDQESTAWLWPVFSRTTGDSIHRWRVFPFYGESHAEGKFDKRFVLWPLWNDVTYHYPTSQGSGFLLFPLYGRLNLSDQKTTWVLPPFFRFTRGEERNILNAPWPFIRYMSGDVDMLYVWPLWGRKQVENVDRSFVLWPIFWREQVEYPESVQTRHLAVPVFSHTKRVSKPEDPEEAPVVLERRHRLWPLYTYARRGPTSTFRTLNLWPLPEHPSVDRNLAPLWTLYSRVAHEENVDSEILWGLYRNLKRGDEARYWSVFPLVESRRDDRMDPPERSWNLLKGLIGRETKGERSRWRFLYFFRSGSDGNPLSEEP